MARGGVDPIARYLVLGSLGFVGWHWAAAQPSGSWARSMIDQARTVFQHPPVLIAAAGGSSSSSGSSPRANAPAPALPPHGTTTAGGFGPAEPAITLPTGQGMQATSLVDLGGFPLVLDPNIDTLRQDPAQGGTNVYGPGDVVVNAIDGAQYVLQGGRGGVILAGPDGSYPAVDQFFA